MSNDYGDDEEVAVADGSTSALHCKVYGDGLSRATVRRITTFTIEACDASGTPKQEGGDVFFVAIRGGSRVRASVTDNEDGTYTVHCKPSVSGKYSIAISLFGLALAGSPFDLEVLTPAPEAHNCVLQGEALKTAVSRVTQSFEVTFRDALGQVQYPPPLPTRPHTPPPGPIPALTHPPRRQVAHAEELDVYVEPFDPESGSRSHRVRSPRRERQRQRLESPSPSRNRPRSARPRVRGPRGGAASRAEATRS